MIEAWTGTGEPADGQQDERWAGADLRFIAEATRALNASLDEATTIATIARLAVEGFADWCAIDLVDADGRLALSAIEHREPALAAYARSLREQYPLDPAGPIGPYAVLRTGSSQFLPSIPLAVLDDVTAGDPEQAAILARLAIRSFFCVPLAVQGQVLGTLSAVATDARRPFTERDLHIAEEVSGRAAAALQNARLFTRIRQHAQAERARAAELEGVIQSMHDGVLVTDLEGRVVHRNLAASAILGAEATTWADVTDRMDGPAALPAPGDRVGRVELRLASPGQRWLELTASPVTTVEPAEWVVILRDITQQHQAAAVRDTFIDVLSHELRTPVTSISVAAALLAERPAADERTRSLLADLRAEVDRLRLLVEDVVALTRYGEETGGPDIPGEPILLQRLAERVVAEARVRHPAATFRVTVPATSQAAGGDAGYVEHVLRNLLGNAAKFAGPRASVEVAIAPEGSAVVTRVLDDGPGFSAGDTDHVFDRFYRSPATARIAPGSGIGLFVAARLVEAMGGRIWARNRPEGGAEVGFSLPQAQEG